jgi:hypothetical protein
MVYCGLLLWLQSVRFVDTTDTLDSVDLFDLFLTSVEEKTESQLSSTIVDNHSISLWEAYTRYSAVYGGISIGSSTPINESLIRATTQLLNHSVPSSTSFLSHYLSTIGQYSVISRMASVLVWGGEFTGTDKNFKSIEGISQSFLYPNKVEILAATVEQHQLRSSVALGDFICIYLCMYVFMYIYIHIYICIYILLNNIS